MNLRVEVTTAEQLAQAVENDDIELIYAPVNLLNDKTSDTFRIVAVPPLFLGEVEWEITNKLKELKAIGINKVLAHTAGHLYLINSLGMKPHGGHRLNITNSLAEKFYEENGLIDSTLSIEMTMKQAHELESAIPKGIIGYGKLSLMALKVCPTKDDKPCKPAGMAAAAGKCTREIVDRKGNKMKIICDNTVEVENPDTLVLSDRQADLQPFDFVTLRFTDETDINEVINMYLEGRKPEGKLTRGLYYRGVE